MICYSTSESEMFPQANRGVKLHIKPVCLLGDVGQSSILF